MTFIRSAVRAILINIGDSDGVQRHLGRPTRWYASDLVDALLESFCIADRVVLDVVLLASVLDLDWVAWLRGQKGHRGQVA